MEYQLRARMTEWLQRLLSLYRAAITQLSDEERCNLSNLDDFSPPCQIHLFWFKAEPHLDYSCLLRTKLLKAPDGLVEVVGPLHPADALQQLSEVLDREYWSEEVEDEDFLLYEDEDQSIRSAVAEVMHQALQMLDREILRAAHSRGPLILRPIAKHIFRGGGFTWHTLGDLRDSDPNEIVAEITSRFATAPGPRPRQRPPDADQLDGFGTYFYPHLWVGELPAKTPQDILRGTWSAAWMNLTKAVDTKYKGRQMVVNQDGYIAVESDSRAEVTGLLNEIMAVAWLHGLQVSAVREPEISNASIDPKLLTITSRSLELASLRTALALGFDWDYSPSDVRLRPRVTEAELLGLIANAEALNSDPYTQSVLSFLIESYTHQTAGEYRQSLVMAWLVIESWINKTWQEALDDRGMSKKRKDRLSEGNRYTAEVKSEFLNLMGSLRNNQLTQVTTLRRLRNRVAHDGYNPSRDESQEAMEFATELIRAGLAKEGFEGHE